MGTCGRVQALPAAARRPFRHRPLHRKPHRLAARHRRLANATFRTISNLDLRRLFMNVPTKPQASHRVTIMAIPQFRHDLGPPPGPGQAPAASAPRHGRRAGSTTSKRKPSSYLRVDAPKLRNDPRNPSTSSTNLAAAIGYPRRRLRVLLKDGSSPPARIVSSDCVLAIAPPATSISVFRADCVLRTFESAAIL